jgi:hypothetical protein
VSVLRSSNIVRMVLCRSEFPPIAIRTQSNSPHRSLFRSGVEQDANRFDVSSQDRREQSCEAGFLAEIDRRPSSNEQPDCLSVSPVRSVEQRRPALRIYAVEVRG